MSEPAAKRRGGTPLRSRKVEGAKSEGVLSVPVRPIPVCVCVLRSAINGGVRAVHRVGGASR